jgi:putative MATE family efflux protein
LQVDDAKAIRRKVLQLAGPSLTEMVLLNMVQLVNMIMVGRVGPEAVAAVGLTTQPVFLAMAIFMAINVGTTAVIARAVGGGQTEEANRVAEQAMSLNLILSILVVSLMVPFSEPILVLMGATPQVLVDGVQYAKIMFISIVFFSLSMGLSAALRGAGDTRTPMKINIISNLLIILVGFPLIYGKLGLPHLGVVGAAVATLLSRIVASVTLLWIFFNGKNLLKFTLKQLFRIDKQLIGRIIKIGLPTAGEQLVLRTGQIIFTRVVAHLGTIAFAAHQICFTVLGLSFMPGMAFAVAATTLVGQGLGAGKPDLAERFGWETRRMGIMLSGAAGLGFVLFAPYILMIFTPDPQVIEAGTNALRIIGLVQVAQSTQFILAGALRGAGDTRYPLYTSLICVWGIRVILALLFVFGFNWGLVGAWGAIALDQVFRSYLISRRFKKGNWKTLNV